MDINEKLARWAGFTFDDAWSNHSPYKTPDGVILHKWTPFTESLNAIFEWLVPKVEELDGFRLLNYQYIGFSKEVDLLRHSWGIHFENNIGNTYSSAETPALALCLAIEQLIDKGEQ